MADPDLRLLGERIERIQAELRDLRGVRAEIAQLRAELRGEIADVRGDLSELRGDVRTEIAGVRNEMAEMRSEARRFEVSVAERFDQLYAEIDGRFDQIREMMATNLQIVLTAIQGSRPE
jgi:predicted  nucleic acid-binding Zn-ribbon protein